MVQTAQESALIAVTRNIPGYYWLKCGDERLVAKLSSEYWYRCDEQAWRMKADPTISILEGPIQPTGVPPTEEITATPGFGDGRDLTSVERQMILGDTSVWQFFYVLLTRRDSTFQFDLNGMFVSRYGIIQRLTRWPVGPPLSEAKIIIMCRNVWTGETFKWAVRQVDLTLRPQGSTIEVPLR